MPGDKEARRLRCDAEIIPANPLREDLLDAPDQASAFCQLMVATVASRSFVCYG